MLTIFQPPKRKFWLIGGGLAIGILALVLSSGSTKQTQDPVEVPSPVGQEPQTLEPGVNITADRPANIAVGQWKLEDLGTTPVSFEPDQAGFWVIAAYDPESTKQQETTKELDPNRDQTIYFEFDSSWLWSAPLEDIPVVVSQPLVENNVFMGLTEGGLLQEFDPATGIADQSLASEPVQSVVWADGQRFLYLTRGGNLVFSSPDNSWTMEGVLALGGDQSRAGWIESDGQIGLINWTNGQRSLTGINGGGADGVFVGDSHIYLFSWEVDGHADDDHFHPSGQLQIYQDDPTTPIGRVDIETYPQAMAELGDYSFWLAGGNLYILDNSNASIVDDWRFNRPLAGLISGPGPDGQPTIYLLTETGEIWDFNLDRQTYNLVGQSPAAYYQPRVATYESLTLAEGYLYFGFLWGDLFENEQTFRVRLTGP